MQNTQRKRITDYIENELSEKRKSHTYAVAMEAMALANHYAVDPEKAELAAFCHDIVRGKSQEEIDAYIRQFNLDISLLGNSNLAHAKIAAVIIKQEYEIEDQDIINAVSYHTTGRAGMSTLEKILYLADAIEPGRRYIGVESLRKLAYENLDLACIKAMDRSIDFIRSRGLVLHRDTINARNHLMKQERRAYE
jgi:predicted HD superfamily hydrolase involved in NAD metabolism